MKNTIEQGILATAALTILLAMLWVMASTALSLPVVKKSATTGECVEVESATSEFTCDRLPIKYELVWVK